MSSVAGCHQALHFFCAFWIKALAGLKVQVPDSVDESGLANRKFAQMSCLSSYQVLQMSLCDILVPEGQYGYFDQKVDIGSWEFDDAVLVVQLLTFLCSDTFFQEL